MIYNETEKLSKNGKILLQLRQEALKSDMKMKHACAIYLGNKKITEGHNIRVDKKNQISCHAEENAFHKVRYRVLPFKGIHCSSEERGKGQGTLWK